MSDTEDQPAPTVAELTARIEAGWETLQAALAGLTAEQLGGPQSDDGWTVKDHLAHIAAWERSAVAILTGHPRHEALGVEAEVFEAGSFDAINAAIQARSAGQTIEAVLEELVDGHQTLLAVLAGLGDEDLLTPYQRYQAAEDGGPSELPVYYWVAGNTFGHYEEHIPWLLAIADRQDAARATGLPGVWRRHNQILLALVDALADESLTAQSLSKGRSAGQILAHVHAVRLMWLDAAAPELAADLAKVPKEEFTHRALIRDALAASGAALATLLERTLPTGKVKGFKGGPEAFFGYLMAHDWYHIGELGIVLKQGGHALPEELAYGLWDQWAAVDG